VKRNDKKKATGRMTATAKDSDQPTGSHSDQQKSGATTDEGMSPALQAHIGRQVRAMFDEVAEEPIPDHLLQLLKDLDQDGEK
jgi:hypothetical protein